MRGLTDEEREALLDSPESAPMSAACCRRLRARGLIVEGPCVGCGVTAGGSCLEGCESNLSEWVLTPLAHLAIRLDNAARGLGVSGG